MDSQLKSLAAYLKVPEITGPMTFTSQKGVVEYVYNDQPVASFDVKPGDCKFYFLISFLANVNIKMASGKTQRVGLSNFEYLLEIVDFGDLEKRKEQEMKILAEKLGVKDFPKDVSFAEGGGFSYRYKQKDVESFVVHPNGTISIKNKDGSTSEQGVHEFLLYLTINKSIAGSKKISWNTQTKIKNIFLKVDEDEFGANKEGVPLTVEEECRLEDALGAFELPEFGIQEVTVVLQNFGLHQTEGELKNMSQKWDVMKKNKFTPDEVRAIAQKANTLEREADIKEEFDAFGLPNLKLPQVIQVLQKSGIRMPEDEIKKFITSSDLGNKNDFNYDDVRRLCQKAQAIQNVEDREVNAQGEELPEECVKKLKTAFTTELKDGEEKPTIPKLHKCFTDSDISITEPEVQRILKDDAIKQQDKTTFDEVKRAAQKVWNYQKKANALPDETEKKLKTAYDDIFKKGAEKPTEALLQQALQSSDINASDEDMAKVLKNDPILKRPKCTMDDLRRIAHKVVNNQTGGAGSGNTLPPEKEKKLSSAFGENFKGNPAPSIPLILKTLNSAGFDVSEPVLKDLVKDDPALKQKSLGYDDLKRIALKAENYSNGGIAGATALSPEKEKKLKSGFDSIFKGGKERPTVPLLHRALTSAGIDLSEIKLKKIVKDDPILQKKNCSFGDLKRIANKAEYKQTGGWGGVDYLGPIREGKLKTAYDQNFKDETEKPTFPLLHKTISAADVPVTQPQLEDFFKDDPITKQDTASFGDVRRVANRTMYLLNRGMFLSPEKQKLLKTQFDSVMKGGNVKPTVPLITQALKGAKIDVSEPEVDKLVKNDPIIKGNKCTYDDLLRVANKAENYANTRCRASGGKPPVTQADLSKVPGKLQPKEGEVKKNKLGFSGAKRIKFTPEELRYLMKLFNSLDTKKTGLIDAAQLQSAFKTLGSDIGMDEINERIKNAKPYTPGKLSFREFSGLLSGETNPEVINTIQERGKGNTSALRKNAPADPAKTAKKVFLKKGAGAGGATGGDATKKGAMAGDNLTSGASGAGGAGGAMRTGATGGDNLTSGASGAGGDGSVMKGMHTGDYEDNVPVNEAMRSTYNFLLEELAKVLGVPDFKTKDTFFNEPNIMEFAFKGEPIEYFVVDPEFPAEFLVKFPGCDDTKIIPLPAFNEGLNICVYGADDAAAAQKAIEEREKAYRKKNIDNLAKRIGRTNMNEEIKPDKNFKYKYKGEEMESFKINPDTGEVNMKLKNGKTMSNDLDNFLNDLVIVKCAGPAKPSKAQVDQAVKYLAQNIGLKDIKNMEPIGENQERGFKHNGKDVDNFKVDTNTGDMVVTYKDGSQEDVGIYDFLKKFAIVKYQVQHVDIETTKNRKIDINTLAQKLGLQNLAYNALVPSQPGIQFFYNDKELESFVARQDETVEFTYKDGKKDKIDIKTFVINLKIQRISIK